MNKWDFVNVYSNCAELTHLLHSNVIFHLILFDAPWNSEAFFLFFCWKISCHRKTKCVCHFISLRLIRVSIHLRFKPGNNRFLDFSEYAWTLWSSQDRPDKEKSLRSITNASTFTFKQIKHPNKRITRNYLKYLYKIKRVRGGM